MANEQIQHLEEVIGVSTSKQFETNLDAIQHVEQIVLALEDPRLAVFLKSIDQSFGVHTFEALISAAGNIHTVLESVESLA